MDELAGRRDLRVARKVSRSQYSTALTSWLVVASMSFTRCGIGHREAGGDPVELARTVAAEKAGSRSKAGSAASAFSHAISTRTRRRISANSLKCSCNARVLEA